ncbi:hypothetical protein TTHERM_00637330 (macronuclear) [Tetrahymena thermophila SB210]|uniref:Uncharacterized protein n=1 Tax=Tetrahymena thermophila (strain SB210) TaxID=312017 RepID=Q22HH0_TETTS|nr:hypothetical protein TTHERM_00637330 [Tetrahymena thermophila SB210]EAR84731.3 hypothetical protein TTHERM_00637330 [Tetrahymena thermophila SB210]|eukprot:XP_001032394.3 hypothetical protein TTHERM_00637330 [Tetrahymena thermophila SB210]
MGNEGSNPSNGKADGKSSLGNYDSHSNFGSAFKAAHKSGGLGHTFTYQGKMYTTNTKDGGDYRKEQDNRGQTQHYIREKGHKMNAAIKDTTGIHKQDKLTGRGYTWTSDVDRQREKYHKIEREKQQNQKKK